MDTLKLAMEIGKWGDGDKNDARTERELTMQAMILWEQNNLPKKNARLYGRPRVC